MSQKPLTNNKGRYKTVNHGEKADCRRQYRIYHEHPWALAFTRLHNMRSQRLVFILCRLTRIQRTEILIIETFTAEW